MVDKRELRFFLSVNSFAVLFVTGIALIYLRGIGLQRILSLFLLISFLTLLFNFLLVIIFKNKTTTAFWISLVIFDIVVLVMSAATGGIDSRIPFLFVLPLVFAVYNFGLKGGIIQSLLAIAFLYALTQIQYRLPEEEFFVAPHGPMRSLTYFLTYTLIFAFLITVSLYFRNLIRRQEIDFLRYRLSSEEILNTIPSGVITLSPNNEVVFANKSSKEILKEEEFRTFLQFISKSGNLARRECTIGGKVIGYSMKVLDDETKVLVFQDLTEAKRLENEHRELEKLAFLGELSANLAHEIRNPVQAISMAMELLLSKKAGVDEEVLKGVMHDVERLSQIVNRFLYYSRLPELQPSKVKIKEVVESAFNQVSQFFKEKAKLEAGFSEEVEIFGDRNKLEELFSNLFRNSLEAEADLIRVEFLKPGGEFKLVDDALYKTNSKAIIIRDNGSGMEEETLKRAKELFFTTKKGGTGFGLAICDRIMRAHGGRLLIFSKKNVGTDVILEFRENEA